MARASLTQPPSAHSTDKLSGSAHASYYDNSAPVKVAWIAWLPNETLLLIFRAYAEEYAWNTAYWLVRLGCVCRAWRELLHGTPSFWAYISSEWAPKTEKLLALSGESRMHVYWQAKRAVPRDDDPTLALLSKVLDHSHRIESLSLDLPRSYFDRLALGSCISFPLLKSLELDMYKYRDPSRPSDTQNFHALLENLAERGSLQIISLHNVFMDEVVLGCISRLSGLRSVGIIQPEPRVDPAAMATVLKQLPALEHMYLRNAIDSGRNAGQHSPLSMDDVPNTSNMGILTLDVEDATSASVSSYWELLRPLKFHRSCRIAYSFLEVHEDRPVRFEDLVPRGICSYPVVYLRVGRTTSDQLTRLAIRGPAGWSFSITAPRHTKSESALLTAIPAFTGLSVLEHLEMDVFCSVLSGLWKAILGVCIAVREIVFGNAKQPLNGFAYALIPTDEDPVFLPELRVLRVVERVNPFQKELLAKAIRARKAKGVSFDAIHARGDPEYDWSEAGDDYADLPGFKLPESIASREEI